VVQNNGDVHLINPVMGEIVNQYIAKIPDSSCIDVDPAEENCIAIGEAGEAIVLKMNIDS
jgi:hypothetical protein